MRILLINNFFRDVGGVERVFFAERELLQHHFHTVIDFSTKHKENHSSPYESYFVSGVDFQRAGNVIKKATRFFYSREVEEKLSALIRDTKPDVAHVHGIFDVLGPTVLRVLHKHNIPIVFTAHAYKLICPNWKLFANGHIDESCKRSPFFDAFNRSVQNSLIKSFGAAASWWWHTHMATFNYIDRIISPSQFLIDKHVEYGWPQEKFFHIPNLVDISQIEMSHTDQAYGVFVGRLVSEKGVDVLIDAARSTPNIPIKIVGDGPEYARLEKRVIDEKILNISFLGRRAPRETAQVVSHARAVVVPSVWYENDSLAVLEAQAQGKVVIASHIGGIPEQIIHAQTGYLFEPGSAEGLRDVLEAVWKLTPAERLAIGKRARGMVDVIRNPELYYEALMDVLGGVHLSP